MFRTSSCPSSGAYQLQEPPLVYRWNVVVAARPRPTTLLPLRSNGKPEAATAVFAAPDDGHDDARNILSCI